MTNETRDLDRAVAEAMGWTNITVHDEGATLIGDRSGVEECYVPRYSTDPSTQAEKLRWLRQDGRHVLILIDATDGLTTASAFTGPADRGAPTTHGITIDQALAALVVAVAKAKKEQGK